jgi:hypothetical protein
MLSQNLQATALKEARSARNPSHKQGMKGAQNTEHLKLTKQERATPKCNFGNGLMESNGLGNIRK